MSKLSDMMTAVSKITVDTPDNPYTAVNNTTVPLADIISVQGIYLQHDREQKEKDAEIARLNEQILSSADMNTLTSQMQENIDSLTKKLEDMSKKLDEKNNEYRLDSDKYNDLKLKYDNLEKSYADVQSQKMELEKSYNESLEKEKELSTTIDALTKDVDDLKHDNDILTTQHKEVLDSYDKLKADYDTLNTDFETLKSKPTADMELTVDYIKSKGFTFVDFTDGYTKRFLDDLMRIIKPKTFDNEVALQSNVRGLLDRLVFVVLDNYLKYIKGVDYYNKECTSVEFFNTAIKVVCDGYDGSDMEEFIFRPFAKHYDFEDMTALDSYLKNRGSVVDSEVTDNTDNTDNSNTEADNTDSAEVVVNNGDPDNTEIVSTDDGNDITAQNAVFDEEHISSIVYDAVLQCFNDCDFDTNINYITKIVAFACVSALHLTPFSCPGYFGTYDAKRNAAISVDIMETMLKGIFREKLERVKPILGDEDGTPEQEAALWHMHELDGKVADILKAEAEFEDNFYESNLGDGLY